MSYSWTQVLDFDEHEATIEEDLYETYQSFRTNQRLRQRNPLDLNPDYDVYFTGEGEVEEIATMELNVIPPTVRIDNENFEGETRVIVEGANRLGTLVEISQCVTEMNLNIRTVHVCSDDGWCFNELRIIDPASATGRVTDARKLDIIKQMLNPRANVDVTNLLHGPQQGHTVLELSGPDRPGLLSEVTEALESNGFKLCSVAVWTQDLQLREGHAAAYALHNMEPFVPPKDSGPSSRDTMPPNGHTPTSSTTKDQVKDGYVVKDGHTARDALLSKEAASPPDACRSAFVLSVMDDPSKSSRNNQHPHVSPTERVRRRCFTQLLSLMRNVEEHAPDAVVVRITPVDGPIHHDRRLHRLLHAEEAKSWAKEKKSLMEDAIKKRKQLGLSKTDRFELFAKEFYSPPSPPLNEIPPDHNPYIAVDMLEYGSHQVESFDLEPYYWHLHLRCKDRTKLLLDVASTLADMNFDVRHACIDSRPVQGSTSMMAEHTYFLLPKRPPLQAQQPFDERKADLVHMMKLAVTRRFPQGQKIKVKVGADTMGAPVSLGRVASALKAARLNIARAHALPYERDSTHTFVITTEDGRMPRQDEVTLVFRRELGGVVTGEGSSYSPFMLTLGTRI